MIQLRLCVVSVALADLDELKNLLDSTDLNLFRSLDHKLLVAAFVQIQALWTDHALIVHQQVVNALVVYFDVGESNEEVLLVRLVFLNGFLLFDAIEQVLHREDEHA